jgi:excisionase family DNA binding protein
MLFPVAIGTEELVQNLIDLKIAQRSSRGTPAERVRRVEGRVRRQVGPGVPKAVAARVLGVSVPTVDKWITRGRIPTIRTGDGPRRVAVIALVDLAAVVEELRERGQTEGLVAAALLRLEQADSVYRDDLGELYGDSLTATQRGELVPATIPDTFGPED